MVFRAIKCLGLFAGSAFLWGLDPQKGIQEYLVTSYGTDDGLPHYSVTAVIQTSDLYLWIGTQAGLAQFDGVEFRKPSGGDSHTESYYITAFCQQDDTLWLGTRGHGLYSLNLETHQLIREEIGAKAVYALELRSDGMLWLGTENGIRVGTAGSWDQVFSDVDEPVRCLDWHDQFLYVGAKSGLMRFDFTTGWPERATVLLDEPINAVCVTDHQTYAGGDHGLFRLSDGAAIQILEPAINDLLLDQDGNLWAGSDAHGLFRLTENVWSVLNNRTDKFRDRILALWEDHEGNLWVASHFGLIQLQDSFVATRSSRNGLSSDIIWSIHASQGRVAIGTEGGALNIIDSEGTQYWGPEQGLESETVISVYIDRSNRVWAGTRDGLYCLEGKQVTKFGVVDGLIHPYIRCLIEDRKGDVWIGTKEGISVFSNRSFVNFAVGSGIAGPVIRAFCEDRLGRMWVGTDTGLCVYDGSSWRSWTDSRQGLSSAFIRSIFEDRDGNIWLGTYGGGICRYKDGKFESIGSAHGLPHDVVFFMMDDPLDRIWMASHQSIFRADRRQLMDVLSGRSSRVECEIFGDQNDILPVDFTGGVYPSAAVDGQGKFWFPTFRGAFFLDPLAQKPVSRPPPTSIRSQREAHWPFLMVAGQRTVPQNEPARFEFTALTFKAPKKVRFFTKLEGLDHRWHDNGNLRSVTYSKLAPGTYKLHVKAVNHAGIESLDAAEMMFVVPPFYYQTWWFRTLLVAIVCLMSLALYRRKVNRAHAQRLALEAEVRDRTADLKLANDELSEIAQELARSQEQLLVAAHHAGKAEVAADVLHNIGNYLNRLNVSNYVLREKAQQIDGTFASRLSEWLNQLESEGGLTIVNPKKRSQTMQLLAHYGQNQDRLKSAMTEELDALDQHVKLLGRVIQNQHAVADGRSYSRALDLSTTIKDLVDLQRDELEKRDISCELNLETKLYALVPVHKIAQVIQNAIRNAVEALEASHSSDCKLIISLKRVGSVAEIRFEDNGVGASPDIQKDVFRHGFSTKTDGLGFGLHYSANVMAEINGSIKFTSPGPGKGACLVICVPLKASKNRDESNP